MLPNSYSDPNATKPWYAIQTRPRYEKKVGFLLQQKGYECLIPTYWQKRRWSDRTVKIDLPLFPTYVFCRFNASALGKAVMTPGAIKVIGFGGKPVDIPEPEIHALQKLAQSDLLREPWKYLAEGTLLIVETGPLSGVRGILCQNGDDRRLIISVTLLQRSVCVRLDEDTVVSVAGDLKYTETGVNSGAELASRLLRRP
ncbi:MAG TPA: transcription termination/antitermination NusG family protein [Blastocatellia bacterium]|nr:transcription termination/antitermination NusG family protein [Blastocatellia bacterium]